MTCLKVFGFDMYIEIHTVNACNRRYLMYSMYVSFQNGPTGSHVSLVDTIADC